MKKGFWRRFILALVLALSIFLPNVLPIDRAWAEEALLRIIFVALNFLAIDQNMQYIIKGLIILAACSLDMRKYLVRK